VRDLGARQHVTTHAVVLSRRGTTAALSASAKSVMRSVICTAWIIAVVACGLFLISYENTAGPQARAQTSFPKVNGIQLDPHRFTLILFAHPKCPCTRATVNELNRVLSHTANKVSAHVCFLKPAGVAEDWTQTALWKSAADIPGVKVHEDLDSAIAKQFGASTSGDVVLYSPDGKLLFHGGITAGRGHEGDNAGASALVALVNGENAKSNRTPVYGCLLEKQCNETHQETTQ